MEYLVLDLKEKLTARRKSEFDAFEQLDKECDKELIMLSAGKIYELDFIINSLNELLSYAEKSKK
jgi:hypothetical protein